MSVDRRFTTGSRRWMQLAMASLLACAANVLATPLESSLDGRWEFRLAPGDANAAGHPGLDTWREATVPGNVHTDLRALGLIPDLHAGAPEANLQWIGLADWEYRRDFNVDATTAGARRIDLVFDGLDTFAEVSLNGVRVLDADNSHRTWRVPVQGRLRAGRNLIAVTFGSPIKRLLPTVQAMPHKIAGNYPSPHGDEPRDAMTGNFARKPGYHYGWDWGPRYVTAGIWRTVRLQAWNDTRIDDLHVEQASVTADEARLAVKVAIDAGQEDGGRLRLAYVTPGGRRMEVANQRLRLSPGLNRVVVPVTIAKPERWFPAGYGPQALYRFEARVERNGKVDDRVARRTGLRRVELRRDHDQWGQGMAFVINGIPIFAKGANAIPFDSFPSRVTREQLRRVMQSARDANMNMIRNWGGGYYESEDFFDLADELGLMVWQDFMFGGGMQPAYDPAFRASVVAEARDNIRRLRHHPSIVLWCGNNEEETAWKDWGQGRALREADSAFADKVWAGYVALFDQDLRRVVAEEAGGLPYWSSSPSNDLATKANDSDNGDKHYWDVWAGSKPIDHYLLETPRFMSEYGLQAWPVMRTIRSFANGDDLRVDSDVLRAHQKFLAGKGNDRLLHYIREGYGEPRDFTEFVYLGQVMQAEGIELAALHHRASRPRTMGSLYWQLNDVWPGASWSGIDWFGRWKPLQFHARRFFAPVAVSALRRDGQTRLALVSDRTSERHGQLRTRIMDMQGRILHDARRAVVLPPLAATALETLADEALLRGSDPARTIAVFDLAVDGEPASRQVVYFGPAKALQLPDPGLHWQLTEDGDAYRLEVSATRLARGLWIESGDLDADLSDNALTLLPGETVHLRVTSPANVEALRSALSFRSLAGVSAPARH